MAMTKPASPPAVHHPDVTVPLAKNAVTVLERRYLIKDETGQVIESPDEMFHRVARNLAQAEGRYGADVDLWEDRFYRLMRSLEFLPNSPTLMNAGRPLQQLSACFVLPVADNLSDIFLTIRNQALVHQTGGGTGFAFSRLRPKNDIVMTTKGKASGPVKIGRASCREREKIWVVADSIRTKKTEKEGG